MDIIASIIVGIFLSLGMVIWAAIRSAGRESREESGVEINDGELSRELMDFVAEQNGARR